MANKEDLAARLNGRQYRKEIGPDEEEVAKQHGLIVIFGASDDLCELRGAIKDEVGCYDGGTVFVSKKGELIQPIDNDDIEVLEKYEVYQTVLNARLDAIQIEAEWCKAGDYSWTYSTAVPHAIFDIMEDEEKYCRGIVIDLNELRKVNPVGL